MNTQNKKWTYLIILSIIWGSSFILIKKGLVGLSPVEVGAFRILITALTLLLIGSRRLKNIKKRHIKYIIYTALLGTFFPSFLFAIAITNIDSSISAILNSLTPFNTFLVGVLFFSFSFKKNQLVGILIGLVGTLILIVKGAEINPTQNYLYSFLVIASSVGYAFNVNIVKKHLYDLDSVAITAGNFLVLIIPTLLVLYFTNFFVTFEVNTKTLTATGYVAVLALFGTALAKIYFNKLVQISTPIFSSSVTYLIPIVAVMWGLIDGEKLHIIQLISAIVILYGVYWVNKKGN